MDWLNLHTSVLDSPEFLGAEPIDRATWLCLLRYCIGQENGGTMRDSAIWGDRKWQQLCRVTGKEASRCCDLWVWDGDDLQVRFYPVEKEREIQSKRINGSGTSERKAAAARDNGAKGGRPKKPADNRTDNPPETHGKPIEGKGREGKGREQENPAPDMLAVMAPGPLPDYVAPEHRWLVERLEPWAQTIARVVGTKIGKSNWPQWQRLCERYRVNIVAAAADGLPALDRWPDQTEAVLEELSRAAPHRSVLAAVAESRPQVVAEALEIVERVGWEAAKAHLDCRDAIRRADDLRDYLTTDPAPHEGAQQIVTGAKAQAVAP